ncbi:hypothetical protein MLD38_030222 [Melastoma candidum]|uniref:Uncharacterized protein n=1 Tax=Melastoma candidum TaxID=119954 RepID=A0ACB9MLM6_9MYRT|nr:hypothetical protein MLD38_030222 [Melastoma candidum]
MDFRWVCVAIWLSIGVGTVSSGPATPMNCTDTTRVCTSFLAFKPLPNETLSVILSMFDVFPEDVTVENPEIDYVFVRKNCSCLRTERKYATNTTYTVRSDGGYVYNIVSEVYDGLAILSNSTRTAKAGSVVSLRLFCGCSSGLWNYLVSYLLSDGDSVESLASRFGVSMGSIEQVNGIASPDNVTVGDLYYIPLNSVPGEPYPSDNISPVPGAAPTADSIPSNFTKGNQKARVSYGWILGSLGIGIALLVLGILLLISFRSSGCCADTLGNCGKNPNGKVPHNFQLLRNPSILCGSGRYMRCKAGDWRQTNREPSNNQINIPKALGADVFDVEKPVVFSYEDVLFATEGFSKSNLLGHGTYGTVYHGVLHDQELAVKRMTVTKTKEFLAEMKVLCKVHHSNLVELLGYAATDRELFLIYEYAQNGPLKTHLHDPQSKGQTYLSWIMRVQIALDVARGLEYIHEHTKNHYVHRDIKTSNILLDGSFRAKISDFGLAKLIGKTGDAEASVTKVVGSFGYLAPEYLSNGLATTKSDVYAFGVVLFELVSGKEATICTESSQTKSAERRSLVSIMLSALRNVTESTCVSSMKDCIDPNLMDLYPEDCLFKVVMLGKQCVDDDPILRPDMKQVVISLSQILLSSIEWEATLAGNSQVFSGLVRGR